MSTDASTPAQALEARIRALEDEREIRELLIRYAQRLDSRDHGGYARLFAERGTWSGRLGEATGPEAIEAMLEGGFGKTPNDFVNTDNFHLMSNFTIAVSGDAATAQSRLTYFARSPDNKPVAMLAGRYEDRLVREGGHWLFQSRKVIGEIPTMAEVSGQQEKRA